MTKGHMLAAAVGAFVATALAGGIAWGAIGDGGVIQGCVDAGGNLKVVAALPCPKGYTSLPWNQQGVQGIPGGQGPKGDKGDQGIQGNPGTSGTNGVSVTSEAVANCNGLGRPGSKFTAASGTTYACDGAPGTNGTDGANGQDGAAGVSVTSESESAGANCANGGSKFTAANDITYACNGAQGPPGPGSSGGFTGYERVEASISGTGLLFTRAYCPLGKRVLGGGFAPRGVGIFGTGPILDTYAAVPGDDRDGWFAEIGSSPQTGNTLNVWAICATVG